MVWAKKSEAACRAGGSAWDGGRGTRVSSARAQHSKSFQWSYCTETCRLPCAQCVHHTRCSRSAPVRRPLGTSQTHHFAAASHTECTCVHSGTHAARTAPAHACASSSAAVVRDKNVPGARHAPHSTYVSRRTYCTRIDQHVPRARRPRRHARRRLGATRRCPRPNIKLPAIGVPTAHSCTLQHKC